MAKLNLITNGIEQEKIKEYLENNASETLAEKINNGVKITKDNKTLLSKKDLTGFWKYATEEARKIAEKGARGAYVDDNTVYGWAIHYFEEDSIEGTLYNEDGTEYKPAKPVTKTVTRTETKPKPAPKNESQQATLFDMFNFDNNQEKIEEEKLNEQEDNDDDDEDISEEELQEVLDNENVEEIEEMKLNNTEIDYETGEIITKQQEELPIDIEIAKMLYSKLDGKLSMK